MWYIIICPHCNLLQTVRANQKTHTCFKCRVTLKLDYKKIKILYKSDNIKEVNYILLRLKEKQSRGELRI